MSVFDPEIAWAAGFFDGEGSVRTTANAGTARQPVARCTITNTDPRPVTKFHDMFGGCVYVRENKLRPRWRRSFEWTVQGAELDAFVRQILPYSVTKREQLELLVEFRKLMPGRGYRKITSSERWSERKRLSKLSMQISELKWVEAE
jgi:hypothetical protein